MKTASFLPFLPPTGKSEKVQGFKKKLSLAVLGLCCCTRTFSSYSDQGLLFLARRHVESSRSKDGTRVSCIGRWILNHWTTREVLKVQDWKGMFSFSSSTYGLSLPETFRSPQGWAVCLRASRQGHDRAEFLPEEGGSEACRRRPRAPFPSPHSEPSLGTARWNWVHLWKRPSMDAQPLLNFLGDVHHPQDPSQVL